MDGPCRRQVFVASLEVEEDWDTSSDVGMVVRVLVDESLLSQWDGVDCAACVVSFGHDEKEFLSGCAMFGCQKTC